MAEHKPCERVALVGYGAMAVAISQHRRDQEPLAISLNALAEDSISIPEASVACVGDVIDVSMQDGFLRCPKRGLPKTGSRHITIACANGFAFSPQGNGFECETFSQSNTTFANSRASHSRRASSVPS